MADRSGARVRETTSSTGTGNIITSGAVDATHRTLASVLTTNGDTCRYLLVHMEGGNQWETGVLTRVSATEYSRSFEESSTGSILNLSAGLKHVGILDKLASDDNRFLSLTIAGGVLTLPRSASPALAVIDTEASAASDDLDTISGGYNGQILVLRTLNSARDVTIKHLTGNLVLTGGADAVLGNVNHTISLIKRGGDNFWSELSRNTS